MTSHLPTITSASWTVTSLQDSLASGLAADNRSNEIQLFFYAVTESGWKAARANFRRWLARGSGRRIRAYVGTDHAITEADAIRQMANDGLMVRLMTTYQGIFHPKVIWMSGPGGNTVWIGSNNLTRDGILNNIEFAAMLKSTSVPPELDRWAQAVHAGSVDFSDELLNSYESEREAYGRKRASLGNFTWSRRELGHGAIRLTPPPQRRRRGVLGQRGNLILEVMPRETGVGGKQIQSPMRVATTFFGLSDHVGATRIIRLTPSWVNDARDLTMTIFRNHTVRLVIKELDYRDRPCVLLFSRHRNGAFSFEIVPRSVFPARYRGLLEKCGATTRHGSRRWGIIE